MTSKELLQADLLDILFDNRNKQYGAYTLRRDYNKRLLTSLGSALGIGALLFLLIPSNKSQISELPVVDSVVVRIIDLPKDKPHVEPPRPAPPVASAPPVKSLQFTEPKLVDYVPTVTLPPQDDLFGKVGATTSPGVDVPQVPPITDPKGKGDGGEPAKPEVQDPTAPVQQEPEFPGGMKAWIAFLQRNLRVPDALEAGEKKVVHVQFIVAEDGSVTGFNVLQSSGALYDNEVIRVLKRMPKWKPAIRNNLPAARIFTQPVTFMGVEE